MIDALFPSSHFQVSCVASTNVEFALEAFSRSPDRSGFHAFDLIARRWIGVTSLMSLISIKKEMERLWGFGI